MTLIDTCLRKNVFFYPEILAQFNRDSVPDAFIWVGIEEVKRFAFALHKVAGRVIPNATTACVIAFTRTREGEVFSPWPTCSFHCLTAMSPGIPPRISRLG